MKATKIITKESPSGKFEFIIEAEKEVVKNTISLDGVECGSKTEYINNQAITVKLNGKVVRNSNSITKTGTYPELESRKEYENVRNRYAYIDTGFGLTEETYNELKSALDKCIAEVTTDETIEQEKLIKMAAIRVKQIDDADQKEYETAIKNGLCPKCHTYCHGDCRAN